MPPASDRYSVVGASSHSGSGANMNEKNRNIKEKAKELRNAVHHSLRNGLGECECHSCDIKRQSFQSTHSKDHHSHHSDFSRSSKSSLQQSHSMCCCQQSHNKDSHCNPATHRKYNSEESSHRTVDYTHENYPEEVPPIDNTKIFAWMERNEKYKHKSSYPDPMPSPAVRRKKQTKEFERNANVAQAVQPIAQDLGMPLLPQPDTGNLLEEVKRVLEEPEQQRVSPVKKMPTRLIAFIFYYPFRHSPLSVRPFVTNFSQN